MLYIPGDYVCVDIIRGGLPARLMGSAIRYATHSKYTHAFIITTEDGEIIEARPEGAAKNHISEYKNMPMFFSTTDLTHQQREGIVSTALSLVGTPYGFLDIGYIGLATAGIEWEWLLDEVKREDRMICSQLVAHCGISHGVRQWLCGKSCDQLVTPADLARQSTARYAPSSAAYPKFSGHPLDRLPHLG